MLLIAACLSIGGSVALACWIALSDASAVDVATDARAHGDWARGASSTGATNLHEVLLARSRTDRVFKPWLRKLRHLTDRTSSKRRLSELAELAATAGVDGLWTPTKISLARLGALATGFVLAGLALRSIAGIVGVLTAILLIGLGWRGFDTWLINRARLRQEKIVSDLPDIADQVAISVQAGLSFEQAMRRTVDSTTGPLSREFERFLQDVRVGMTRSEAFRALQTRVDVADVTTFVRSIAQAERTGMSIGDILQIQADELREKRKQRAEERAMKLPVLMLMPLVTCVLPPLLMLLLGPVAIDVIRNGLGV